ncbi:Uncharacterised protein [Streptococcus mitis]|uniref:Uncharacterized protein n=1 Tax=Streptococcus mitis TaxID=28037 RepID=A0A4U9ZFD6_STRMT|nr:hypothetical protein [Streptococcus mitis]VTS38752.1 Uncharacterised protein [Streptococcus mitis]
MDLQRFKEIGCNPKVIPAKIKNEDFDYLAKITCIWFTFQYYSKFYTRKPPKNYAFYDVLMQYDNSEEFRKYRTDLGIPENEYGYPTISSRTLQRIFSLHTINKEFVLQIFTNNHFQRRYIEAYNYFFWDNSCELVKPYNKFLKNLMKLASFQSKKNIK